MSTISIGRVGLAATYGGDAVTWAAPSAWDQAGDNIVLSGIQQMSDPDDLLFWRQQVLALADGNELAVPVVCASVADLNGWYQVTGAQVQLPPGGVLGFGALTWTVTLSRPADWRSPRWESTLTYGTLTNGLGYTGRWWWTIPFDDADFWELPAIPGGTVVTATLRSGDAQTSAQMARTNAAGSFSGTAVARYVRTSPQTHYDSGARIEAFVGSTWRPVQGMTCPVDPASIRISNGTTRIGVAGSAFTAQVWDPSGAWGTQVTMTPSFSGSNAITPAKATVIENTPERCTVRLLCTPATSLSTGSHITIDVTLRRGTPNAEFRCAYSTAGNWRMAMTANATIVGTSHIRQTSSDAFGNQWTLLSNLNVSTATAPGSLTAISAATSAMFCLGWIIGGTADWTAVFARDMFFGQVAEISRPVVL